MMAGYKTWTLVMQSYGYYGTCYYYDKCVTMFYFKKMNSKKVE